MAYPAAARRIPVLAVVVCAHALALLFLFELTRSHPGSGAAEESLTLVYIPSAERPRAPESPPTVSQELARRERAVAPPVEALRPPSQPAPPDTPSAAIDWAAEGVDAAERVARGEDKPPAARTFGMAPPSPMFDHAPARRPGLAWNHARTHRVEALPGGVTVFNLNDHCAIALVWVVPFFGCQIGKIPARGDLLSHMRDAKEPDPH